jgi:uncharacterized membrane protein
LLPIEGYGSRRRTQYRGAVTEAPQNTDRLVLFTDAVVAIAITLLVLPLVDVVGEAVDAGEPSVEVITGNLQAIFSFVLSFVVIARLWLVHHRLFALVATVTRRLVFWNMLWVFTIVALPFVTQMVGAYGDDPFTQLLYIGTIFASSVCLAALSVLVKGRVVPSAVGPSVMLAVAFVLVLVVPAVGYFAILLLAVSPLFERLLARKLGSEPA